MANIMDSKRVNFFFLQGTMIFVVTYTMKLSGIQISKTFCPNIDLGVLWLKDAIIVLLETIPCPQASEYWREW